MKFQNDTASEFVHIDVYSSGVAWSVRAAEPARALELYRALKADLAHEPGYGKGGKAEK